jgi:hypothetical protein
MKDMVKRFTRTTGRAVETCEQKRSAPAHLREFYSTKRSFSCEVIIPRSTGVSSCARGLGANLPESGDRSGRWDKDQHYRRCCREAPKCLSGRPCKLSGRLHYSPCCTTIAMQKTSSLSLSPRQRPGQACRPNGLDAATTPAGSKLWRVFFMVEAPGISVAQGSP